MKQGLYVLAAATAALIAGPAGATETRGALYGDLRFSVDYTDDERSPEGPVYSTTDNNSIWGVKASTRRGGVTAFGAYERFMQSDVNPFLFSFDETRQAYVGISSLCGTFKLGRHPTAYSEAGRKLDPFYDTAVSGLGDVEDAGAFVAGNGHGTSIAFNGNFRDAAIAADHLAYRSPAFRNFSANVAMFTDDIGPDREDHNYGAGLEYAADGVTVGVQYIDANGAVPFWGTNVDASRFYAGYAHTHFGLGLSWEHLDYSDATDTDYTMVSGWYGVRADTRIAVSVGIENSDFSIIDGESIRAGVFHDLIEDFTVWAAALHFEGDGPDSSADVVTLGASYKFDLGFSTD